MKKILCTLTAVLLAAAMCSCSPSGSSSKSKPNSSSTADDPAAGKQSGQSGPLDLADTPEFSDSSSAKPGYVEPFDLSDTPPFSDSSTEKSDPSAPLDLSDTPPFSDSSTEKSDPSAPLDLSDTPPLSDSASKKQGSQLAVYQVTDRYFHYYKYENKNRYYAIVEITNTGNTDLLLKDCDLNYYDNSGTLLGKEESLQRVSDVIVPGEKGYFYVYTPSGVIPKKVPLDNGIKAEAVETVVPTQQKTYDLPVSDVSTKVNEDGSWTVSGKVSNDRDTSTSVVVHVLLRDENGRVIAIEDDYVSDINPGTRSKFEVTTYKASDPAINKKIKDCTVIARW